MWMKNEEELVRAALEGDRSSFEELLYPYRRMILNAAYRMTGDVEDSKEIAQESVIKVFRYLRTFKKGWSFKSWVYRIVMNSAYDFLRAKKKDERMIEVYRAQEAGRATNPERLLLNKEIREKIQVCLQKLSPKEKSVYLLRDVEGFSPEETARIIGGSSISVRTHLSRARRKIREKFDRIYPGIRKGKRA